MIVRLWNGHHLDRYMLSSLQVTFAALGLLMTFKLLP